MADEGSGWFEKIQWGWAAAGAVIGWFGKVVSGFLNRKRRKKALLTVLIGLPPECKAILADFYKQGTHTRRTDPFSPPMNVLTGMRIIDRGPGGGGHSAIDCYMTVVPDVWEVMDDWIAIEVRRSEIAKLSNSPQ